MSRPVRWGILGSGAIAAKFAADLRHVRPDGAPAPRLQAVASRDGAKAAAFAARHGAARSCASYEALVADDEVDIVYVATPNAAHRAHALMAIAAGKAVLCEKPFALDAAEAREIAVAARAAGVFCMEAMWTRFLPVVAETLRIVAEGGVGEPTLLRAAMGFRAPDDPRSRFNDPALGGGALLDLGVYGVSMAHALFGAPDAVAAHLAWGAAGADRQAAALLEFPGGAAASITASHAGELVNTLEIFGTEGRIVVEAPFLQATRARLTKTQPLREMAPGAPGAPGGSDGAARAALKETLRRTGLWPLARGAARRLLGRDGRLIERRFPGEGYQFEIEEAGRRLAAGEPESPLMSLDETVAVMTTLDRIRAAALTSPRASGPSARTTS